MTQVRNGRGRADRSTPSRPLLGASALATGFTFEDSASRLIAGLVALFAPTYRLGDRVQIGDTYGQVRARNLGSVNIVTPDDTAVHRAPRRAGARRGGQRQRRRAHDAVRGPEAIHLPPAHDGAQVRAKLETAVLVEEPYLRADARGARGRLPDVIQVCADPTGDEAAGRELRSLAKAGRPYPKASRRLLTLTRDAVPPEAPRGVTIQPAYE